MRYLATPLLLFAIIVGCISIVLGLAVLAHIAGPSTVFGTLVILLAGQAWRR